MAYFKGFTVAFVLGAALLLPLSATYALPPIPPGTPIPSCVLTATQNHSRGTVTLSWRVSNTNGPTVPTYRWSGAGASHITALYPNGPKDWNRLPSSGSIDLVLPPGSYTSALLASTGVVTNCSTTFIVTGKKADRNPEVVNPRSPGFRINTL